MHASYPDQLNAHRQNSCPKLGLKDDPASFSTFPSKLNGCTHVYPVETPSFEHQWRYCLQNDYPLCPIYKSTPGDKMPKEILLKYKGSAPRKRYLIIGASICFVVITLLIFFRFRVPGFIETNLAFTPTSTEILRPTMTPTSATENLTGLPNFQSPTKPTATETPISPTPTQTNVIFALDTPIGDEQLFVIHRVAEGETLQLFANKYHTSVEAITAINFDLIVPLWSNWLVIIPVNTTDVSELPLFEAHQVEEGKISIQDLANQLSASLEEMLRYNNLDVDYILKRGDWLLVPRKRPQP